MHTATPRPPGALTLPGPTSAHSAAPPCPAWCVQPPSHGLLDVVGTLTRCHRSRPWRVPGVGEVECERFDETTAAGVHTADPTVLRDERGRVLVTLDDGATKDVAGDVAPPKGAA